MTRASTVVQMLIRAVREAAGERTDLEFEPIGEV